jgi:hypothetical protein
MSEAPLPRANLSQSAGQIWQMMALDSAANGPCIHSAMIEP